VHDNHIYQFSSFKHTMRLIALFVCLPFFVWTQVPDSLQRDSLLDTSQQIAQILPDSLTNSIMVDTMSRDSSFFVKRWVKKFVGDYPNPNKALLLGLIVPGGGQIYNGSMWKVPLVYGAYGTTIYLISTNNRQYNYWRDQYARRVDREGPMDDLQDVFSEASQLQTIRDEYRRRRDYSWVALVGVTIVSVADAFVDCHLKKFDISDDLTWEVSPILNNTPGWGQSAGIGLSIPIR